MRKEESFKHSSGICRRTDDQVLLLFSSFKERNEFNLMF
nr:MAG TPA: hypothetical protein [Caudoviricetes sp.]